MSIQNPVIIMDKKSIRREESFQVQIRLDIAEIIRQNPKDIVFVLDCSGSMRDGGKFEAMKKGVIRQIDILTEASGGVSDKLIAGANRAGIIQFSTEATAEVFLTQNVDVLKNALENLVISGVTNHAKGFLAAEEMLKNSVNKKVVVMFTDAATGAGMDPSPIVERLKADGVEIFCIGMGIHEESIAMWVSLPLEDHLFFCEDAKTLERFFPRAGFIMIQEVLHDIHIMQELNPEFRIQFLHTPVYGNAEKISDRALKWDIETIRSTDNEILLNFDVIYVGNTLGTFPITKVFSYSDREGNSVNFPNPKIIVECENMPIIIETCPNPVVFTMNGCEDYRCVDLGHVELENLGRIVELSAVIKSVCPNKRVAVAVQLVEIGTSEKEYPRGLKVFTLPAHESQSCTDIRINCIRFVLPEDIDISEGKRNSLCNDRHFKARIFANYIDTDFVCCDTNITMI